MRLRRKRNKAKLTNDEKLKRMIEILQRDEKVKNLLKGSKIK